MSFGQQKKQWKPKPAMERKPVGGIHAIDPVFEAIIAQRDKVTAFNTSGNVLPSEMISFTTPDGQGVTVEAFKAYLVTQLTFCVPFDSPGYPEVKRLDTKAERGVMYPVYRSRIKWKHSEEYWHVPGYSRYVTNEHGHVKNAYNGLDVMPNEYGRYAMFADMPGVFENKEPYANVTLDTINMLANRPLPSDFIDYGMGKYSHEVRYDKTKKIIDWCKRPEVIVRDGMGSIEAGQDVTQFGLVYLSNKDIKDLRKVKESELYRGAVQSGQFTVKLKDDSLVANVTPVAVNNPAAATQPAPAASQPMSNLDVTPQSSGGSGYSADMNAAGTSEFDDNLPF